MDAFVGHTTLKLRHTRKHGLFVEVKFLGSQAGQVKQTRFSLPKGEEDALHFRILETLYF